MPKRCSVAKFVTTQPLAYSTGLNLSDDFSFDGVNVYKSGVVRIEAKYTWDGCSPKWLVGGVIIGAWDGFYHAETRLPQLYHASLVHDVLIRYRRQLEITPRQCNAVFNHLARNAGFPFWPLYALALWLYWLGRR